MSALLLGYIRPELNYISKEALVEDINTDVRVALKSLSRDGWAKWARELATEADQNESMTNGSAKEVEKLKIKLEFG